MMRSSSVTTGGSSSSSSSSSTPGPRSRTPNIHEWPLTYLVMGILVGIFGLWGFSVQILTSEAWFSGKHVAMSLLPHFGVMAQVFSIFMGNMSQSEMITYTWGWGVQVVQLLCSVGLEWPKHNRFWDILFSVLIFATIALNSLADFFFGGMGGFWQQVGFALICFLMSFSVGKIAIHFIVKGIMGLLRVA